MRSVPDLRENGEAALRDSRREGRFPMLTRLRTKGVTLIDGGKQPCSRPGIVPGSPIHSGGSPP